MASSVGITPFVETLGLNWSNYYWSASVNLAAQSTGVGDTAFKGTKYVKANFTQAWGGIQFAGGGGFNTSTYTNLSLAIRNWSGGQGLYLYVIDGNGVKSSTIYLNNHVDVWYFPEKQWKWLRVPIALLNLTTPTISSIFIETDTSAEIHYDEIRFDSSVTLYEGVQMERGPTNMFWHWGSTTNEFYEEAAFPGDKVLRADFTQSWGGLQFEIHYHSVFSSSEYQYVSLMTKTFDAGQNLYMYFIDADTGKAVLPAVRVADHLPLGSHTVGKWQRIRIPVSALLAGRSGSPVRVGSFVMENGLPGTVLIDNFVVENPLVLQWPLETPYGQYLPTQNFGEDWAGGTYCPVGVIKKHNGTDYHALSGAVVYAAEAGVVKHVEDHGEWAQHIVIEHTHPTKGVYTTVYWHVVPAIAQDAIVSKKQVIANVADISFFGHVNHLHFGLRFGSYNSSYFKNAYSAGTGALPQLDCMDSGTKNWYPAFPADFVDPDDPKNVLFQQ